MMPRIILGSWGSSRLSQSPVIIARWSHELLGAAKRALSGHGQEFRLQTYRQDEHNVYKLQEEEKLITRYEIESFRESSITKEAKVYMDNNNKK
jgi:hypothetical protein